MAKSHRKCGPCTPLTIIRNEFAAAKKATKSSGSCAPMQEALQKIKPLIQAAADSSSPRGRALLHREVLSKEMQTQKACAKAYQSKEHWVGFEGVRGRRRAKRRR